MESAPLSSCSPDESPAVTAPLPGAIRGLSSSSAATEKHCFLGTCAEESDVLCESLSAMLSTSHRKQSRQVEVSLLQTDSQDLACLAEECGNLKIEASYLRAETKAIKTKLKHQRRDIDAIQVEYQSAVSQLHRELCALRGLLRQPAPKEPASPKPRCPVF